MKLRLKQKSKKKKRSRKAVRIEEQKKKEQQQAKSKQKIVIKKKEVQEDIRTLRIGTPPIDPKPKPRKRGLKPYTGDRFGTRGDYSGGMLYLSRLALPDNSAAKQKQKKQVETVVVAPVEIVEEDDSKSVSLSSDPGCYRLKNNNSCPFFGPFSFIAYAIHIPAPPRNITEPRPNSVISVISPELIFSY